MSQKENSNNFIVQGAILGVAAILVRVLGLLYQMPLTRVIGDMGNGYYSYAYNIYSLVLLISSFSIPLAVSKIVSARLVKHQFKNAQRVLYASLIYVMVVAGICAILTFVFASRLLPDSQSGAVPALKVLCPVIFLAGILGVLRGYFQGYNTMIPTSFSQILEGILNAVISVLAAYILVMPYAAGSVKRATYGAVGSTLGTAAGVAIGLLFMLFVYVAYRPRIVRRIRHDRHRKTEDYGDIFKLIFVTVTPVLFSSLIYNVCPIIDQTLFANILEAKKIHGQDISVLQGIYSAKYLKLVSVPASIAAALSSAIIPAITANVVKNNLKAANHKIDTAMKFTMLIALPSTVGLIVLARPIMLLFGRSTTLVVAVHVLIWGAVTVIFNCISTLTNAVLQGLDDMKSPVIHGLIALTVHIAVVIYFLNKNYGIYALILGTLAFSLVIWILNWIAIYRITGYRKLFGSKVINITLASVEMGFCTFFVYQVFYLLFGEGKEYIGLIAGIITALASYLLFLYLSNAFTENDYEMLPMGNKIRSLGIKLHLVETYDHPFEEELAEIYEEPPRQKRPQKKFIFRKQEAEDIPSNIDEIQQNLYGSEVKQSKEDELYSAHTEPVSKSDSVINTGDEVVASLLASIQKESPVSPSSDTKPSEAAKPVKTVASKESSNVKQTEQEDTVKPYIERNANEALKNVTSVKTSPALNGAKTETVITPIREASSEQSALKSHITDDTEPINVSEILKKFQKQEDDIELLSLDDINEDTTKQT